MEYCPNCAGSIKANSKTCPHCKKVIDINEIESLYNDDTVELKKSVARGIWLKENSRFIFPIIFLLIGLFAGAVVAYSYSLVHFASVKSNFEEQIQGLQQTINTNASQADQSADSLRQQLDQKDQIINILKNQRQHMGSIINFTRRLAENSTVTTADPEQVDYYSRNVRYLISQYIQENEKMTQLGVEDSESYNLQTIPQLLAE